MARKNEAKKTAKKVKKTVRENINSFMSELLEEDRNPFSVIEFDILYLILQYYYEARQANNVVTTVSQSGVIFEIFMHNKNTILEDLGINEDQFLMAISPLLATGIIIIDKTIDENMLMITIDLSSLIKHVDKLGYMPRPKSKRNNNEHLDVDYSKLSKETQYIVDKIKEVHGKEFEITDFAYLFLESISTRDTDENVSSLLKRDLSFWKVFDSYIEIKDFKLDLFLNAIGQADLNLIELYLRECL